MNARRLVFMTANQLADEVYGLHCDIGRLEVDLATKREIIEKLTNVLSEIRRISTISCELCSRPCHLYSSTDMPIECEIDKELKDLGIEL